MFKAGAGDGVLVLLCCCLLHLLFLLLLPGLLLLLACKYLSQGQKRRVALARLVKERRPLWVLDEPFVALDVAAVDWLAGIISGHLQRGGLAVMTTHQPVAIPAGTVRELKLS